MVEYYEIRQPGDVTYFEVRQPGDVTYFEERAVVPPPPPKPEVPILPRLNAQASRYSFLFHVDFEPTASIIKDLYSSGNHPLPLVDAKQWGPKLVRMPVVSHSIAGGPTQVQRRTRASFGQVEIAMDTFGRDIYIDQEWDDRPFWLYMGPYRSQNISDFDLIAQGYIQQAEYRDHRLILSLTDGSHLIARTPTTGYKYLGTGLQPNGDHEGSSDLADITKPMSFGRVDQLSPQLIDSTLDIYRVHFRELYNINVRDRGVPLTQLGDLSDVAPNANSLADWAPIPGSYVEDRRYGIFRLGAPAAGPLDCDVVGDNRFDLAFTSYPLEIFLQLADAFPTGFSVQASDFNGFPQYPPTAPFLTAGFHIPSGETLNLPETFDQLMQLVHGFWYADSRSGKYELVNLNDTSTVKRIYRPTDMVANPAFSTQFNDQALWAIDHQYGEVSFSYSEDQLSPTLDPQTKSELQREFYAARVTDQAVRDVNQFAKDIPVRSLLSKTAPDWASPLATQWLDYAHPDYKLHTFRVFDQLFVAKLGDYVELDPVGEMFRGWVLSVTNDLNTLQTTITVLGKPA